MANKSKIEILSDTQILIEREFDAPVEVVWKISTDPELIPQWWGPKGSETIVDKMDFRIGGEWRFLNGGLGFRGVYNIIEPNRKLENTFEFEPYAGYISTESGVYKDKDGKTLLKVTVTYLSKEHRDGVLGSGMEGGMNETHDRLEELAKSLNK